MSKAPLLLVIAFGALAAAPTQESLGVAAAANLSSLAPELGAAFSKRYPAYRAEFVLGASGTLVAQLLHGSPARVFLSADLGFAQRIVDAGRAAGPVRTYAYGSLILLSTRGLDLSKGLGVLAGPEVARVAVANPETAPYGRAALECLRAKGLYGAVAPKIVTGQNITQALQFTLSGADAGFVNKSALRSPELAGRVLEGRDWIEVEPSLYSPIAQGFVLMKTAASDPAALAFADFLLGPEARAVFAAYGYAKP